MPDDTADAPTAADLAYYTKRCVQDLILFKAPPVVNPDRVGEELADDAHIWHVYDRVAKDDDERRTKAWDTGLNNLALFAGLFSAVTTAFIIEARQDLEPDYAQLTFLVLNATAFGEKPAHQTFAVSPSSRTVNSLWIASLILSLSAALIAIMGKDWIGMYTARPVCNLRQWAEMRTYRLLCVERWYMSGVIAAAPVLLHVSLLLFGAGLVLFISSDPLTHHLTIGLSLSAGALYLVTTLSAVVFSASPFKSPATQMIRAALSSFYWYLSSLLYRPTRKPLRTLISGIHAMVLKREDSTPFLPGGAADSGHRYTGLWRAIVKTPGAAIAYMRRMPSWLCTMRHDLQCLPVNSRLHSIALMARRLSFDWSLSSTWTDLPADRRPKLLAETLSWLSGASQAPDAFRAIVFALGDLDVGPQVGVHTSLALRTRLRAEIRHTWKQIDFLTLSRYVLADRNTPGVPVLDWFQFTGRFDLSKDSALRCEDGMAAVMIIDYIYTSPSVAVQCFPDQLSQPKMFGLLLPHILQSRYYSTELLILVLNRHRSHLRTRNAFNLEQLEAQLYQTLSAATRDEYANAVTDKYGGARGAIELLTFLCCHDVVDYVAVPAAVELIMELLASHTIRGHRCLAYLFGNSRLWEATWKDKHWSEDSLYGLSASLELCYAQPFQRTLVRTLSDDRQFNLALARTVSMLFSPQHGSYVLGPTQPGCWMELLHDHLSQAQAQSFPDDNEESDLIRIILESAALLTIAGMPDYFGYDSNVVRPGTAVLAAIIDSLACHLRGPATNRDGERLFAALVSTEVKGPKGDVYTWNLAEWLRTRAPEILKKCPSSTAAMQDVHDALSALYPLCEHNSELRAHWDRIGYPGRPGDLFSSPFLDLGEFFANAEDPLPRSDDSDEFLNDAEETTGSESSNDEGDPSYGSLVP